MEQSCYQCSEPAPLTDGYFRDIAFNGAQFLLLDVVNSEIYKYDCNFRLIEAVAIKGKFTSICYAGDEQCYFALSNYSAATIYRLDESFNVIGQTRMHNAPQCSVNNICYDWCSKTIWISFPNRIAFAGAGCAEYKYLRSDCDWGIIRCVLALPRCRLLAVSSCEKECIHLIKPNCKEKMIINIPEGFRIESMCTQKPKESHDCCNYCVCILLTQLCSQKSYIMCCTLSCCKECPPDESQCSCTDELCQIIHSIALEEAGISHILNAEGEKIQKAVACCKSTKELLEINDSVRNTITNITQLEIQLTIKLETAMRHVSCKNTPCIK